MWTKVEDKLPPRGRYLVFVQIPGQIRPTIEIAKRYTHNIPEYVRKYTDPNFAIRGLVTHWDELPDEPV